MALKMTIHNTDKRNSTTNYEGCAEFSDRICDTPPIVQGSHWCREEMTSGSPAPNSCTTDTPTHDDAASLLSFMSYNEMDCKNAQGETELVEYMFTAEQVLRMQAILAQWRVSVPSSPGALPPPSGPAAPDLWMADTLDDTGSETPSDEILWASPDIWIRNKLDKVQMMEHQNPIYGQTNYVKVRVRNRGLGDYHSGGGMKVKLYWAKGGTSLGWPSPWKDGSRYGGLVGEVDVGDVLNNPPGAQMAGATIVPIPWNPPNPADYADFGGEANHFCLLARLVDANDSPGGTEETGGGDALWRNVENRRRVVWKNVEVAESGTAPLRMMMSSSDDVGTAAFTIGGHGTEMSTNIDFLDSGWPFSTGGLFGSWGEVWLHFPQVLWDRWQALGAPGSYSETEEPNTIIISNSEDTLQQIPVYPGERFTIQMSFRPYDSTSALPKSFPDTYHIDVVQYSPTDGVVGGQRMVLKTTVDRTP